MGVALANAASGSERIIFVTDPSENPVAEVHEAPRHIRIKSTHPSALIVKSPEHSGLALRLTKPECDRLNGRDLRLAQKGLGCMLQLVSGAAKLP
jgi:hypothetical protein